MADVKGPTPPQPQLTPAQTSALAAMQKATADLQAQEGKVATSASSLIAAIHNDMLTYYQTLLGIPITPAGK